MQKLRTFHLIMIVGFVALGTLMAGFSETVGAAYPYVWFGLAAIFAVGGIGVIVMMAKEKVTGWLKASLLTSGIVSLLFIVVTLVHNWMWILGIAGWSIALYYVAMFACPAVFLIAACTAGWLLYHKRQS